ncbi:ribonuclease H-like domain-containing protein [Tanacetum coccineum]
MTGTNNRGNNVSGSASNGSDNTTNDLLVKLLSHLGNMRLNCSPNLLGKHVRLPFVSSDTVVTSCFDIIHSDVWNSSIPTLLQFKYYCDHGGEFDNHNLHTLFAEKGIQFRFSCLNILTKLQGTDTAYLLLYVDDIVLTASSETLLQQIISSLHQEFSMTDRGSLDYFLGIFTPVNTESKLGDDGDPVSDPTLYRSLAGSLQYLTFTRPDISFAVQQVCLYMHDHREPHFSALKRVLRYVRGTLDYGLQLFSFFTTDLVAYSNADWAGCPTTRRSTLGYCVFLGNNLVSWSSKRQPTLSRSSAEVEYRGVANAVAEAYWLRNLLRKLHIPLSSATLVYCDNASALYLSSNPVQHQRTKHIEIDTHFVRDLVAAGQVRVPHVPSRYQYADIFTKGLPSALFEEFHISLSVRCPPAPTAGEC